MSMKYVSKGSASTSTPISIKSTRRKLDPRRPLQIYRPGEINDADATPVGLDIATGVDKEEEREIHLQNYMQAYAQTGSATLIDIPVPDATRKIDMDEYTTLYPIKLKANASPSNGQDCLGPPSLGLPSTLIRFSAPLEDLPAGFAYNLDELDIDWLVAFRDQYNSLFHSLIKDLYPDTHQASIPSLSETLNAKLIDPQQPVGSLSPPRKRVRRGTSMSPVKSICTPNASKPDSRPQTGPRGSHVNNLSNTDSQLNDSPPPLVHLSEDVFELVMQALESAMNEHAITESYFPSVEQVLDLLHVHPEFLGPQFYVSSNSSSSISQSYSGFNSPSINRTNSTNLNRTNSTPTPRSSLLDMRSASFDRPIHSTPVPFTPQLHTVPTTPRMKAFPPEPTDPPNTQVQWWIPHVYKHWKDRRLQRNNKPIIPTVCIEDPSSRNEGDPYVCFRRREVKLIRKTRRSDTQAFAQLKRIRTELDQARALMGLVLNREYKALERTHLDRDTFCARLNLRRIKRQMHVLEESDIERYDYCYPIIPKPNPQSKPSPLSGAAATSRTQKLARMTSSTTSSTASGTPKLNSVSISGPTHGPKPYTYVQQVNQPDRTQDLPSVSELHNRRVDAKMKEFMDLDAGLLDVSFTPHAIFHPLSPIRVPGGKVNTTGQSPSLQSVPVLPLAWRTYTTNPSPQYRSPAVAFNLSGSLPSTQPGTSTLKPMFTSPKGMYNPGFNATFAANTKSRTHQYSLMRGAGTPPTPPGTPLAAGYGPGVHLYTHESSQASNSPHAWLESAPLYIRRALLYPYAAAAAIKQADCTKKGPGSNDVPCNTGGKFRPKLCHPLIDGKPNEIFSPTVAAASCCSTIIESPSTRSQAISTPSPSPDIISPLSSISSDIVIDKPVSAITPHPNQQKNESGGIKLPSPYLPVPLSPASVAGDQFFPVLPSRTRVNDPGPVYAPGTSSWPEGVTPESVFASLFDPTSSVATKLRESVNVLTSKPQLNSEEEASTSSSSMNADTHFLQWAFQRRVGRNGRVLVDRQCVLSGPTYCAPSQLSSVSASPTELVPSGPGLS